VEVRASFHHSAQGERDSPERSPLQEGELNAQQRAFLLDAANLCPVGAILGFTADIRTRPDATACGQNASILETEIRPAVREPIAASVTRDSRWLPKIPRKKSTFQGVEDVNELRNGR
jgi:hypothetical protein